jgi:hypothetical protein
MPLYPAVRTALALALLWLGAMSSALAAGTPDALTADGGRYYGPLVDGKLHGRGRIEWENGAFYEGEFANGLISGKGRMRFANGNLYEGEQRDGLMSGRGRFEVPEREVYEGEFKQDMFWGRGELRYQNGSSYRGEFVRSEFHGKGRYESPYGELYEGDFSKGEFTGGRHTSKNGGRYEGEFHNWMFHGRGRFSDRDGEVWEGKFVEGQLQGPGKASGRRGTYEGEFKDWRFHGKGRLRLPSGEVYEGTFVDGVYEGQRTHLQAERKQTRANVEVALYAQKELLDKALASLKPREPGKINLYLLTVAGDGSQEVFRREVDFVQGEFARRFDTAGRSVALVNSRNTAASAPMATVSSIRQALKAIAARMDREQDILFLFLTSHGSHDHELTLNQNGMDLQSLRAAELGALLKESGIRWKVVVVSACYSGGFIDPLQDERTLVITAARRDRRSFGCADENDFTYFGRAYFKESLPKSRSFVEAFRRAEALVRDWERKDAGDPAPAGSAAAKTIEENQSLPQISNASAIDAHLKRWWAQSPR